MNVDWEHEREPSPDILAAYFDGELPPEKRVAIETWLATHPEGRAEVESLRQIHSQYDAILIPEPTPERWDSTLAAIEADVQRIRPDRHWNWAWLWLVGSVAAAVLGLLLLRPEVVLPEDVEPFPVIRAGDVHVISMNPNDREALVIVEPLELIEIDLANHNEVNILGGVNEGMMRIDDWASPMIVDPLAYGGPR